MNKIIAQLEGVREILRDCAHRPSPLGVHDAIYQNGDLKHA
jgi:hypothetical protein